jgi:5-hydroxyisourate hydrolase
MGISTHILDTTLGLPAPGVLVTLEVFEAGGWTVLRTQATDADGRCKQMLPEDVELVAGFYRLRFATGDYFAALEMHGLYPWVELTFEAREGEPHFHIPLLLTANGFTTYRGS